MRAVMEARRARRSGTVTRDSTVVGRCQLDVTDNSLCFVSEHVRALCIGGHCIENSRVRAVVGLRVLQLLGQNSKFLSMR